MGLSYSWYRLAALAILSALTLGQDHVSNIPTYIGCFSSHQPLTDQGYYKFQSSGWCNVVCTENASPVFALSNGTNCWCGHDLPPIDSQVRSYNCDSPCQGYDLENCGGGNRYYTVWETNRNPQVHIAHFDPNATTTTSAATHQPTTTSAPSTLKTTSPKSATSTSPSNHGSASDSAAAASPSKPNDNHDRTLGIALGVVLGVVALAVLIGVLWLVRRRRRRTGNYFRDRTPSPAASTVSVTEIQKSSPISLPNGSAELPTTENRESGALGNSHLYPPVFLNPSLRQSSEATSYDQPFYTPAEQRSFYFTESENDEPPVPGVPASIPPSLPHVSIPPPNLDIDPSSGIDERLNPFTGEDVGLGYMSTEAGSSQRTSSMLGNYTSDSGQRESSILHHYPSGSEVDRFDFSAPGQRASQVQD